MSDQLFHKQLKSLVNECGAGHVIVGEPATAMREYAAEWGRSRIDLDELARLRWVEKWPIQRLQAHFGLSSTTIKKELRGLRASKGLATFRVRKWREGWVPPASKRRAASH